MEIQDLTYENRYRKPIIMPDQPFTNLPQEPEPFRTSEGIIEISISAELDDEMSSETAAFLEQPSPLTTQTDAENALSIEDLRSSFRANSAELTNRLRQFYSSQGIQAPIAADMTVDSQGRVVVSGDFEQNSNLQVEFDNDANLSQLFSNLSDAASVLRAADASRNFKHAYDKNPDAALKGYEHLFSDTFKFTGHYENDEMSAAFRSQSGRSIEWWPNS